MKFLTLTLITFASLAASAKIASFTLLNDVESEGVITSISGEVSNAYVLTSHSPNRGKERYRACTLTIYTDEAEIIPAGSKFVVLTQKQTKSGDGRNGGRRNLEITAKDFQTGLRAKISCMAHIESIIIWSIPPKFTDDEVISIFEEDLEIETTLL